MYSYVNSPTGHSWLNLALNEQVFESYLRIFLDNQPIICRHYNKYNDNDNNDILLSSIFFIIVMLFYVIKL